VLVTHRHPHLGLHRLRLAGELTEVRASDLRFCLQETRELLDASPIGLSASGLERLRYPVPMTVDYTTDWPCLPWASELLIAIHSGGATMEVASPGAPPGVPDMFVTADPGCRHPRGERFTDDPDRSRIGNVPSTARGGLIDG
jgi:hypothetical protein